MATPKYRDQLSVKTMAKSNKQSQHQSLLASLSQCRPIPPCQLFPYGLVLQGMNENQDLIFELFREIFSVKTTDREMKVG